MHCRQQGNRIGHGCDRRKPRAGLDVYPMRINCWRCKECGRTTSTLPGVRPGYRQSLLQVIEAVLAPRFEYLASSATLLAQVAGSCYPAVRTIQCWFSAFGEQAQYSYLAWPQVL